MMDTGTDNLKELKDYLDDNVARKVYGLVGDRDFTVEEQYGALIVRLLQNNAEIIVTPTIEGSDPYIVPAPSNGMQYKWDSALKAIPKDDNRRHGFYNPSIV
jgi:hypothetical protein